MIKVWLTVSFVIALPLQAMSHCDEATLNHVDYMQCLDQQLLMAKQELTSWENNHLFKLEEQKKSTGRQDGLRLFNKARQSFELYSEHDCRWQFVGQLPDGKIASAHYKECKLYHLKQRIELLKHTKIHQ